MFKKILSLLIIFSIILTPISAICEEMPPVYKLPNGYTAVRDDIFDELSRNEFKYEMYKKEAEYYKKILEDYMKYEAEKEEITKARMVILYDTISDKDKIIALKDDEIEKCQVLIKVKNKIIREKNSSDTISKFLTLCLGAYAVYEIDNSTGQVIAGSITIFIISR